ncbi:MAG: hypothetical protein IH831_07015 [Planctomycetes bacterium]|nr:hypothetical protein [Planctomycetota bacterium]
MAPGAQPIDLGGDGPTANDPFDLDGITDGPNRLLNYPVVNDASVTLTSGNWSIPIDFDPLDSVNYRLEFYRFDALLQNYTHIPFRSETVFVAGTLSQTFSFANGSELSIGDRLGVVAVQIGGGGDGDTSELSFASLSEELDPPPTITDVRLYGTSWMGLGPYSFSSIVAAGEQFRPIFTESVNTLEIEFSEDVVNSLGTVIDGSELELKRTRRLPNGAVMNDTLMLDSGFTFAGYNQNTFTATWTFDSTSLVDGKYAIHLDDSITDVGLNLLDAEWENADNGSPDFFSDDPQRTFDYNVPNGIGDGMAGTMGSEFRFHFALLAGDYDGDGRVEAAEVGSGDGNGDGNVDGADDLVRNMNEGNLLPLRAHGDADFDDDEIVNSLDLAIWEANYGTRLAIHADGDADGDQDVDGDDLAIWENQFGQSGTGLAADFNDDGFVDGSDFLIWQLGQGLGVGMGGDANFDSWVDGFDFLIWQNHFGLKSAWYVDWDLAVATLAAGEELPNAVGAVPQVTNVIISGSISTHDPFSFDTVDGSGSQLVTVPVGGADTVTIVFSENVNVSADSLSVVGLYHATQPTVAEFAYDAATYTAVWRLEGWWFFGDQYLISLTDAITDVDGNWLDGEWVNPFSFTTINSLVSEFPSGDGNPGGNFNFVLTLLPGDIDLDGDVDEMDDGLWDELSGSAPSSGATWIIGDFDGDGAVTGDDWDILWDNWDANLTNIWVLADLNGDFDVDDNDIQTISNNLGLTGATYADGDINGDGVVDQTDLDLAFAQFGLAFDWVA